MTDRFALAPRVQIHLNLYNLLHDLARGQIPVLLQQPACAEAAADVTAHLGRYADGKAVFLAHQHRLDQIAVLQSEQKFNGSVHGFLLHMLGQCVYRKMLGQQPERLRIHFLHLPEIRNPLHIEIIPYLKRPEFAVSAFQ
ncbi:hypothetical protein D3C71_1362890 [compost metagenome]